MSVAKTIAAADRPTPRLTRADALLFRDRWQAVAEFEAQERRAASLDLLWQQTEAIWDFASLMGWLVRGADTQAEIDDMNTVEDLLVTAGCTECDFTNYVRTALTRSAAAEDDTNNRVNMDASDVVIASAVVGPPANAEEDTTAAIQDAIDAVAEAGGDDVEEDGESFTVTTAPAELDGVLEALKKAGYVVVDSEVRFVAKTPVDINAKDMAGKILKLVDALEEHDDVQSVACNAAIPDDLLEALAD